MSDEPNFTPPANFPSVPPLRIHHFLVATAVTAVLLAAGKSLLENNDVNMSNFLESGTGIVNAISSGLAITVIGFGIAWRRAGRVFFNQPGHWLLLFATFSLVVYCMLVAEWLLRLADLQEYQQWSIGVYGVLVFIGWPVINFVAAWKGFNSRWWRWYFIIHGTIYFTIILLVRFSQFGIGTMIVYYCGLLALLAAAVVADRRAGRSRDWAHWLGVIIAVITLGVGAASSMWAWLSSSAAGA